MKGNGVSSMNQQTAHNTPPSACVCVFTDGFFIIAHNTWTLHEVFPRVPHSLVLLDFTVHVSQAQHLVMDFATFCDVEDELCFTPDGLAVDVVSRTGILRVRLAGLVGWADFALSLKLRAFATGQPDASMRALKSDMHGCKESIEFVQCYFVSCSSQRFLMTLVCETTGAKVFCWGRE